MKYVIFIFIINMSIFEITNNYKEKLMDDQKLRKGKDLLINKMIMRRKSILLSFFMI